MRAIVFGYEHTRLRRQLRRPKRTGAGAARRVHREVCNQPFLSGTKGVLACGEGDALVTIVTVTEDLRAYVLLAYGLSLAVYLE